MTMDLVSVEDALFQIRGDAEADTAWLEVWIPVVSEAVRSWLKDDWRLYVPMVDSDGNVVTDSDGDPVPDEDSDGPIVNPLVRGAVLLELASQFRFREGEGENRMEAHEGHGYLLSRGATALLAGLRKPTVA
jgi:hypothetical protein